MHPQQAEKPSRLDEISTDWKLVRDPQQFVLRYAPAIQRYVRGMIKNRHDAEEVAQDFFLRVSQQCFVHTRKEGGRFRDYLKAAVRNAALTFLKRHRASPPILPSPTWWREAWTAQDDADHAWLAQWRRCLLDLAYHALKKHQDQSPRNLFHTVLTLVADYHWEDTKTLAARTSAIIGRPITAAAFRKQVSRARFTLAKLLVQEVVRTLDNPTPERLKEELRELGLWEYVGEFVPAEGSPNHDSPPSRQITELAESQKR